MKPLKQTRTARPKLVKGQTAEGTEYYYSKKPSQKRVDYVEASEAEPKVEPKILVKKKS